MKIRRLRAFELLPNDLFVVVGRTVVVATVGVPYEDDELGLALPIVLTQPITFSNRHTSSAEILMSMFAEVEVLRT